MFIIAEEDLPRINKAIEDAVSTLGNGVIGRVDIHVNLGDELPSLTVTGYWVVDIMRIDVKVKK